MLDRLKKLLATEKPADDNPAALRLAAAALLVEAARMDESCTPEEKQLIGDLLARHFDLSPEAATALTEEADRKVEAAVEIHAFTRHIKNSFSMPRRIRMIEMLWEVVYADGTLHHREAGLLRRVAGLLYIDDRDSAAARRRVLARRDRMASTGDTGTGEKGETPE